MPADFGAGQGAANGVDGDIVEAVKFGGRAVPVAAVGFVPNFPVPGLDFGLAVFVNAMFGPLIDQFAPFGVILGRVGPAGVDESRNWSGVPMVLVRIGMGGRFPGHETDFRVRAHAVFQVSVEDAVEDGPVIDRMAGGVLMVGAGGTPFEGGGAVAGIEEIMGAEETEPVGANWPSSPMSLAPSFM